MKKIIFLGLYLFFISSLVFSYESWLATGFSYGNFFEKETVSANTVNSYIGAPGLDIDNFQMWNDFGFFINISFLFPNNVNIDDDAYNYIFQLGYIIGPAFKININEKMDIKLGFGFSSQQIYGKYNNNSLFNINFGVGGDIGFVYIFNRLLFLDIGTVLNYQFANRAKIETSIGENIEWSKEYSMFGIRPYLRIGFMFKQK